jgi:hypothetical protein
LDSDNQLFSRITNSLLLKASKKKKKTNKQTNDEKMQIPSKLVKSATQNGVINNINKKEFSIKIFMYFIIIENSRTLNTTSSRW